MIYANGDIYEGAWKNDLKHGYGILEKKTGDKYYGYWNNGLKEGQGYYYYSSTGKIYLGEWHEDAPRCGIFTDVDDENIKKDFKKHFRVQDGPALIPVLKLEYPEGILDDSINNVQFIRNIKLAKIKTFSELFPQDFQSDLIQIFLQKKYGVKSDEDKESESKMPESVISLEDFISICLEKLGQEIKEETIELIFYIFEIPLNEELKIDFILFSRLFYLIYIKKLSSEQRFIEDEYNKGDENLNLYNKGELSGFVDDKKEDKKVTMNFEYSELNEYQESNIYDEEY
jgi:hypothetical protein